MKDNLEWDNVPDENKVKPGFTYLELTVQCLLFEECMLLFWTTGHWFNRKSKNEDYVCEQWHWWRLWSSECPLPLSCKNSSLLKYMDRYIAICAVVWAPPHHSSLMNVLHSLCWLFPSEVLTHSFILIFIFQCLYVSKQVKAYLTSFLIYLFSVVPVLWVKTRIIEIQHRKEFTAKELGDTANIQHM